MAFVISVFGSAHDFLTMRVSASQTDEINENAQNPRDLVAETEVH